MRIRRRAAFGGYTRYFPGGNRVLAKEADEVQTVARQALLLAALCMHRNLLPDQ